MIENDFKIHKIPITRTEVFNKLYNAIISGYFKPGDRLIERDLSVLLGVSRTPIREVLRELERMKLVKSEPYKGVFVSKISIDEADEIFVVRMSIEGLAARLCVQNITNSEIKQLENNIKSYEKAFNNSDFKKMLELDDSFHSIIYKSAKNNTLREIILNLKSIITYFRLITLPIHQEETLREHKEILNAIISRDPALAENAVQNHINVLWNILKKILQDQMIS